MADPFSRLLGDQQQGTLMGFIGKATGAQSTASHYGELENSVLSTLSSEMEKNGGNPQRAIMNVLQSPQGQELFASGKPDALKVFTEWADSVKTPPPIQQSFAPGQRNVLRDPNDPNKVISDIAHPTTEVQNSREWMQIANLSDEQKKAVGLAQLTPKNGRNATENEQAISNLVAAKILDPIVAQKLLAGIYKSMPLYDSAGSVIGSQIVDMSDPSNPRAISSGPNPRAPQNTTGGPNGAPAPAGAPLEPGATPGPQSKIQNPTPTDKLEMFFAAGPLAQTASGVGALTGALDPRMDLPEGRATARREQYINNLHVALRDVELSNRALASVVKGMVEMAPNAKFFTTPLREVEKGIGLHDQVMSQIILNENVIKDPNTPKAQAIEASKVKASWERVLQALPTRDEMVNTKTQLEQGTSGAVTAPNLARSATQAVTGAANSAASDASAIANPTQNNAPAKPIVRVEQEAPNPTEFDKYTTVKELAPFVMDQNLSPTRRGILQQRLLQLKAAQANGTYKEGNEPTGHTPARPPISR